MGTADFALLFVRGNSLDPASPPSIMHATDLGSTLDLTSESVDRDACAAISFAMSYSRDVVAALFTLLLCFPATATTGLPFELLLVVHLQLQDLEVELTYAVALQVLISFHIWSVRPKNRSLLLLKRFLKELELLLKGPVPLS